MELIEHRCKRCGGELKKIGEGRWSCPYCACVYDEAVVQKNTRSLHEEFDEVKREIVCNLRRNLYDAVNEEYISSVKVHECASELKKYLPTDFAACFYEVAVSNNVKHLTKYIRRINVEENYSEIECIVRFLIKSLQTEYLLELNNLVERAYKQRDLVLFEKYSTEISVEAEKVEGGVYETKMPRDVFVAYSSKDMETVSELCEVLEGQGLKCFVAARNLRHGKGSVENYDKLLCEAMDHCKSFVFVSSTNSRSFSCDALTKELPYIQDRDIENAPAEHKNNYASMPHSYKKPRVEYRIEESRGFSAPDAISNEFFDGYERVYSPEAVAERVAKQLLSAAEKKSVKKPTPESAQAPVIVQAAPASESVQRIDSLLTRVAIFIEDGEWDDAEVYCEKALDIDPKCTQAYIYKLMIDLRVQSQDELATCKESFEENSNYRKALRFADAETAELLKWYIVAIEERRETERQDVIYSHACSLMRGGSYQAAIARFGEIPHWRDSQEKINKCHKAIRELEELEEANRKNRIYDGAIASMKKKTVMAYALAISEFEKILNWRDSQYKIDQCRNEIKAIHTREEEKKKDDIYNQACGFMSDYDSRLLKMAIAKFEMIPDWKDSNKKIAECEEKLEQIKKKIEMERIAAEKRKKRAIKVSVICLSIIALAVVFAIVLNTVIIPAIEEEESYNDAISLMDGGKYEEAIDAFEALDGYKDSKNKIRECQTKIKDEAYNAALDLMEEGKYDEAIKAFEALEGHKESDEKIDECQTAILDKKYDEAVALLKNKKYSEAIDAFEALGEHKDSAKKIEECYTALKDIDYDAAVELMNEGKYYDAIAAFEAMDGHRDSNAKIEECKDIIYKEAVSLMSAKKYEDAKNLFATIEGYLDSSEKKQECIDIVENDILTKAQAFIDNKQYKEFIAFSADKEMLSVTVPESEQQTFYNEVISYFKLNKDKTYYVSTLATDIEPAIKYLKLITSCNDAKNVIALYDVMSQYDADKGSHDLFQKNMNLLCSTYSTQFCRDVLLSDNIVAKYMLGRWECQVDYSTYYLEFSKSTSGAEMTYCSYNVPYPDVDYDYWDIVDLALIFFYDDGEIAARAYSIDFVAANQIRVYSYKDSKTYTLTRSMG